MPRSQTATVRSVRDRVVRAQRAYAVRLREAREALQPLLEEGDARALDLAQAIDAELSHITHGSAIDE
jgi:hypothetical protein